MAATAVQYLQSVPEPDNAKSKAIAHLYDVYGQAMEKPIPETSGTADRPPSPGLRRDRLSQTRFLGSVVSLELVIVKKQRARLIELRDKGEITEDVLRRQCLRAFHAISAKKAGKMIVAYEPVWAIGTGKTATPQMAADAHALIRAEAAKSFGEEFAEHLRILYGGSVKPENATALMSETEIDGALVGGASLDPKSFATIVKY